MSGLPRWSRGRRHPIRSARRERGFTLIVVMLLVGGMTLLVLSQINRNLSTHKLGVNSSRYLLAETAAQTALRFCEAAVLTSVGEVDSVRVTTAGTRGSDTAAWRDDAKWTASSVSFGASAVALPGINSYECLIEDATADLVPSMLANDVSPEAAGAAALCNVALGNSPRLCKYRITARVNVTGGGRLLLQSEMRFAI
jgi:Tfp pilus assembly protein PilX